MSTKGKAFVALLGAILFSAVLSTMTIKSATANDEIPTQTGDLVVGAGENRTIDGENFILEGNITVNSGGALTIRNSDITINSHYKNQYWVRVYSNATLLVENSILREGPVPGLPQFGSFGRIENFRGGETVIEPEGDNAQVILRNSTSEPRIGLGPDSVITLDSSYISILFWRPLQSVKATVVDSNIQMVHLWLTGGTEENIEMSGLSGGENQSTHLSIESSTLDMEDSWVGMYSLALYVVYGDNSCRKNLTVRDSTLSEIFAVFPIGSNIRLWNMAPGYFENWNIYDSMEGSGVPWNLNIVNTTLNKWKLDFHGVAEIENSRFHPDTWDNVRVTVSNSTIVSCHHSRGGRVKFVNTVISDNPDHSANVRFLYQPEVTGTEQLTYAYEFENSTLGPYAELEITNDNIHCTFKGELSMLISPDLVHWFGGTVDREFPVVVLDENNASLANVQLTLLGPGNVQAWSGVTDENGRASFNLTFGKDNYTEEFVLRATIDNESISMGVGFFTSTPVLLSKTVEKPACEIPVVNVAIVAIVVVAIVAIGVLIVKIRKPKIKPLNRAFALTFALIVLTWMVWQMVREEARGQMPIGDPLVGALVMYSTIMIGYPLIVVGLLQEVRRPTLDFRPHRNWRWIAAGIFLLGIFVLINVVLGIEEGATFESWFLNSFVMETSSFALMFGILFMTRSTPQKSSSYRIMLIGVVAFEVLCMLTYAFSAFGLFGGGPQEYKNFWTETVPTPWFWWDFLSELVILVGAIWLLRRGK